MDAIGTHEIGAWEIGAAGIAPAPAPAPAPSPDPNPAPGPVPGLTTVPLISPLPTAPSRDRPGAFVAEANAFLGKLPVLGTEINATAEAMMDLEQSTYAAMQAAQQAASNAAANVNSPSYTGSSISSLTIAPGNVMLTTQAGRNWNPGMQLRLWNSDAAHMSGVVTSYSGEVLTLLINSATGSGTYNNWQISVLPSLTGLTTSHVTNALGFTPPRPDGAGATGNWPISIQGQAASVSQITGGQVVNALGYTPPRGDGAGAGGTWPINIAGAAAAVAWGGVVGRPTDLSQFSNSPGFINANGRAYPRKADGGELNLLWSDPGDTPAYLVGGSDGTNFRVYPPGRMAVNYANSAGSAGTAGNGAKVHARIAPNFHWGGSGVAVAGLGISSVTDIDLSYYRVNLASAQPGYATVLVSASNTSGGPSGNAPTVAFPLLSSAPWPSSITELLVRIDNLSGAGVPPFSFSLAIFS